MVIALVDTKEIKQETLLGRYRVIIAREAKGAINNGEVDQTSPTQRLSEKVCLLIVIVDLR